MVELQSPRSTRERIWLIHHESPTKVGTWAYANPIVAVLLGYSLRPDPP